MGRTKQSIFIILLLAAFFTIQAHSNRDQNPDSSHDKKNKAKTHNDDHGKNPDYSRDENNKAKAHNDHDKKDSSHDDEKNKTKANNDHGKKDSSHDDKDHGKKDSSHDEKNKAKTLKNHDRDSLSNKENKVKTHKDHEGKAHKDHGLNPHSSPDQKNTANETEKAVKSKVSVPLKLAVATSSEAPACIAEAHNNNNIYPSHKHSSKNKIDDTQNAKDETDSPEESSDDESDKEESAPVPRHNSTRRVLTKKHEGPCIAYNPIDKCWRCDPNWAKDRKKLASCVMGFGRRTFGGRDGPFYKVTDPSDDNVQEPRPGTLRHAVIQKTPLWIIFTKSMTITLKQELLMQCDKTIDGRGKHILIAGGAGLSMQFVRNIIIHNIHIIDIHPTPGGMIRDSVDHIGMRDEPDGDAISIFGSSDIWIDHVSASNAKDGLIDIVAASNAITVSNCHFVRHDKVMLFGAEDNNEKDKNMHVTVAYTHFGKNLIQRMPRARWGFFHIVNNDYTHWQMYALGGSRGASIISQGNRFIAPPDPVFREVTHRTNGLEPGWDTWNWRSEGDLMMNGAFFVESGSPNWREGIDPMDLIAPAPATDVTTLTLFAGPLGCRRKKPC